MRRSVIVRAAGVVVALAVLAVAVQWLLLGFEAEPLMARGRVDDVTDWATDRVSAGAALLAGSALVAVAAATVWVLWTTRRTDRAVITTRRGRHGWTRIDRSTLEDALTRVLEAVDRRNDIVVRVGRRGRVDLRIVTPDPSAMGSSQELRDSIDELAGARNLPIRAGRITVTLPRRMTARRRVR